MDKVYRAQCEKPYGEDFMYIVCEVSYRVGYEVILKVGNLE